MRRFIPLSLIFLLSLMMFFPAAATTEVQADQRCFAETGQCISGRFRQYWEQNGGLPVFGFPTTPERDEANRDTGKTHRTQWFERNRFELHPANQPPYDVLLGRLGDDRLRQRGTNWQTLPRAGGPQAGCLWFEQTGYNVCDQDSNRGFKTYWSTHGVADGRLSPFGKSLALFGLPISEARIETNSSGDMVLTQWFERGRFEWHPHKPDQFKVLLGTLGNETQGGPDPATMTRRVMWGVYEPGVPWNMGKLDAFERSVNKRVSIVHFGLSWQTDEGRLRPFAAGPANNVINHGAIPMIGWHPFQANRGPEQPEFKLSEIYGGRYDQYIRTWAGSVKQWGRPFFLKFGHEMNGLWQFPWSERLNGNQRGDFVKAWRHVHDIFTEVGVKNATWVWCPNIHDARLAPIAAHYPGDAYVDWTCLHGYNFGGREWRSFANVYSGSAANPYNSYQEVLKIAPNKPMMLGEWGSAEAGDGGAKKAAWITDALATQIPQHYPQIRAVVWFNWNAEPGRTWVIHSSRPSLEAFKGGIASSVYVDNVYKGLTASPIPAP